MNFQDYAKAKFDKGRETYSEHPWDRFSVDAKEEIKQECADLYNYSELLAFENSELAAQIRLFSEEIYNRLQ